MRPCFVAGGWSLRSSDPRNKGRVIADGYDLARTLNMSSFGFVDNSIENTTDNGWFADNCGKLQLPALNIPVKAGTWFYNWGEADNDSTLDLVNSVRMDFTDVTIGGSLLIELPATDRAELWLRHCRCDDPI